MSTLRTISALLVVLVCVLAGCSSKAAPPGTTASTSPPTPAGSSGGSASADVQPSAAPSVAAKAAADAKEACGAFKDLISDLSSSPPVINLAVQAASTMTTSGLAARYGDPAHWSILSDDIQAVLKALTAGGTIKPPNPGDPGVAAMRSACR